MTMLTVNGERRSIKADPDTPLLYVLRDELGLNAAKYGCGLGQCGACTVIVDGKAIFSCITPVMVLEGRTITTLEGLGSEDAPGPMQRAFIAEQAAQCGYCIPGMMMRAQGLLNCDPHATDESIKAELQPHLCRCGTHMRILRAVRRAAEEMRSNTADARTGR
jgi:nicotinate dehydrogenase subunit A